MADLKTIDVGLPFAKFSKLYVDFTVFYNSSGKYYLHYSAINSFGLCISYSWSESKDLNTTTSLSPITTVSSLVFPNISSGCSLCF